MGSTDAQLLVAWRNGDRASGDVLVRRHYHTVLRYFELNASWSAEDLTQRTFVACVEAADRLRTPDLFRAYLLGIARRQLVMHRRQLARSRELRSFDEAEESAGPQTRMSTLVARSQEHVMLLRSLAGLPSAAQLVLVLFYWQGLSTPSLARHFAVNEVTVRTRLHRARAKLRDRFIRAHRGHGGDEVSPERLEALLQSVVVDGGPRA